MTMRAAAPGFTALCVACLFAIAPVSAQSGKGGKEKGGKDKKEPKVMTAADSAARREERARKSTNRALFSTTEPLAFTLIANFGNIAKDRDTLSTKRFEAVVVVKDSAGEDRRIPVRLRTRGHFRLLARTCRFVPLRIDFPDSGLKGTPFAGQKGIKLGTHCQNNDDRYDEYTRREWLAYSMFNLITDKSFRARLAKGTYVDSASGKEVASRQAIFIESETDVGRRMGANIRESRGALFEDLDEVQLMNVVLYEYMIGNTDFSIYALHNIRIATSPENGIAYPLAYDFDFSGLVNAHYAVPDPRIGIRNVRERRYRGPCKPMEVYTAAASRFAAKKQAILALIDSVPGFSRSDKQDAVGYLQDFFGTVESPVRVKRDLFDACERKPGI